MPDLCNIENGRDIVSPEVVQLGYRISYSKPWWKKYGWMQFAVVAVILAVICRFAVKNGDSSWLFSEIQAVFGKQDRMIESTDGGGVKAVFRVLSE